MVRGSKGAWHYATAAGAKSYIFQAKVNGKSMRLTIGDVNAWSIAKAQAEARRLQTIIDTGNDPRQVKAEQVAAKEAKAAALAQKQVSESVTVAEAWQAYIADRSSSIKNGKPEWGEKHKAHHAYFVQAGGEIRTRGRRPNEPEAWILEQAGIEFVAGQAGLRVVNIATTREGKS